MTAENNSPEIILDLLAEGVDLEVKKAAGRDGRGRIPKDFFKTYSAMANTDGGTVLLGISEERGHTFRIHGIEDTRKVIKNLWDELNNTDQVSVNILENRHIFVHQEQGRNIIIIQIPRATRRQKPIYLGKNPLTGTYRRKHEGDYRCTAEAVRRMMAEQVEDSRDSRLLSGFGFDDLNRDSFFSYRNAFRATKPDHPWGDMDEKEFLRNIGGWVIDRNSGDEGLSLAGLLMFGNMRSILDAVPYYIVDYRQLPAADEDEDRRWLDRLTTDGSWSGNIYDFYRLTIRRLNQDLKVPFRLKGDRRVDDTPIHKALREALINTLIHADYSGRMAVLVIKQSDLFEFRNPGTMRIPVEDAIRGGNSDCRNRNLQKMFQMIGLGEQAGSGLPRVFTSWKKQHFRPPELLEMIEPDHTVFRLRLSSLIPKEAVESLKKRFGNTLSEMTETERLALINVEIEGSVTHARLKQMSSEHPKDISGRLSKLVANGFLESRGKGRATVYYFKDEAPQIRQRLSSDNDLTDSIPIKDKSIPIKDESIPIKDESISIKENSISIKKDSISINRDNIPQQEISKEVWKQLLSTAASVRNLKRVPRKKMLEIIKALCSTKFLTAESLAVLLGRRIRTLQELYLYKMGEDLEMRYPNNPRHPQQAYRTRKKS